MKYLSLVFLVCFAAGPAHAQVIYNPQWRHCTSDNQCSVILGPCPNEWTSFNKKHEKPFLEWQEGNMALIECATILPSPKPSARCVAQRCEAG